MDLKNDITSKTLLSLEKVMLAQDDVGIAKYQEPLKSEYRYNWLEMAQEEIADMLKYLQCEKERKDLIKFYIYQALDASDPADKDITLMRALDLLNINGTKK